jgi:hypothetical protein
MKFKNVMEFNTTEEITEYISGGNYDLSSLIVDTILYNLKNKKKEMLIVSFITKDTDLIYDIIVNRKDFIETLNQNLPLMERYEDYERCQNIVNALKYLRGEK